MSNFFLKRQSLLTAIVCIMLLAQCVRTQTKSNLIYLHHADSLVGMEINGERARKLIGNVKFTHGRTTVTCNRAIQFLQSNKAILEGEVIVKEDSLTMTARYGTYYGATKVAEAEGRVRLDDNTMVLFADFGTYYSNEKKAYFRNNVKLYDSATVLHSDELTYFRDQQKTIAESNVVIINSENNLTLRGEHFENYKREKYSLMLDHPRATHLDTSGGKRDSVVITADTMETFQRAPERLIAQGNVVMLRRDAASEAKHGIFFTKLDSIELRGTPFVWQTQENGITTQISGDSIFIKLEKQRMKTLYTHGHAFSISEADLALPRRFHQMSGQDLTTYFHDNKVTKIEVDKTATILYYLFDDTKPNGLNNTTGDHITISFINGKIDKLKVTRGVEGKYVPERLINNREQEYNLTGFNWKPKPAFK